MRFGAEPKPDDLRFGTLAHLGHVVLPPRHCVERRTIAGLSRGATCGERVGVEKRRQRGRPAASPRYNGPLAVVGVTEHPLAAPWLRMRFTGPIFSSRAPSGTIGMPPSSPTSSPREARGARRRRRRAWNASHRVRLLARRRRRRRATIRRRRNAGGAHLTWPAAAHRAPRRSGELPSASAAPVRAPRDW